MRKFLFLVVRSASSSLNWSYNGDGLLGATSRNRHSIIGRCYKHLILQFLCNFLIFVQVGGEGREERLGGKRILLRYDLHKELLLYMPQHEERFSTSTTDTPMGGKWSGH